MYCRMHEAAKGWHCQDLVALGSFFLVVTSMLIEGCEQTLAFFLDPLLKKG